MKHLMTILNITYTENNEVIWQESNIKNHLHDGATELFLKILFNSTATLTECILGLDNRITINSSDTINDLQNEPTSNGYTRVTIPTTTEGFTIALNSNNIWQSTTNVLSFNASGGSWGPVRNVFMIGGGVLLSSAALSSVRTISDGGILTAKFGLTLKDC